MSKEQQLFKKYRLVAIRAANFSSIKNILDKLIAYRTWREEFLREEAA